jgi:hypothetical protein
VDLDQVLADDEGGGWGYGFGHGYYGGGVSHATDDACRTVDLVHRLRRFAQIVLKYKKESV